MNNVLASKLRRDVVVATRSAAAKMLCDAAGRNFAQEIPSLHQVNFNADLFKATVEKAISNILSQDDTYFIANFPKKRVGMRDMWPVMVQLVADVASAEASRKQRRAVWNRMYMSAKNALVATVFIALSAFSAKASDTVTFSHPDVLLEYVQTEIERGFDLDGDVRQQRVGVEQLKAYLENRRADINAIGGPQDDPLGGRLEQRVIEIEASLKAQ